MGDHAKDLWQQMMDAAYRQDLKRLQAAGNELWDVLNNIILNMVRLGWLQGVRLNEAPAAASAAGGVPSDGKSVQQLCFALQHACEDIGIAYVSWSACRKAWTGGSVGQQQRAAVGSFNAFLRVC